MLYKFVYENWVIFLVIVQFISIVQNLGSDIVKKW